MSNRILIIDDDSDFKEAITTLLEVKGYSVITADNGKEGIKIARQEKPGLILLDVVMSYRTEGLDIARELSGDTEAGSIPVILTTGIRREMNLSFSLEPDENTLPVKAVLEKPIKPETLLKEIGKHIK
jgi:CheY-like chemotaxis protein